jgi:hypothetical protein
MLNRQELIGLRKVKPLSLKILKTIPKYEEWYGGPWHQSLIGSPMWVVTEKENYFVSGQYESGSVNEITTGNGDSVLDTIIKNNINPYDIIGVLSQVVDTNTWDENKKNVNYYILYQNSCSGMIEKETEKARKEARK